MHKMFHFCMINSMFILKLFSEIENFMAMLNFVLKITEVAGSVEHAKSSDPATPKI